MVLELLALCGTGTEEGAAAMYEVDALFIHALVYKEIFLLRTDGGNNAL